MSDRTAAGDWTAAVVRVGGRAETAEEGAADLTRRYAEPHRSYHTTRHVDAVVRDVALLAREEQLEEEDRAIVALAACAHDVVYDAQPGEDERASAEWARSWLARADVPKTLIDRVGELVLATMNHSAAPGDAAAAVLLDADLAILGSSADDYAGYVQAVRREYATVSDADWRVGRARVLSALAARPRLYLTAPAHQRWAEHARRNLAAELAELEP
jgi:predicted metal-dependent HD superfamily phosphohydrolase